MAAGTSYRSPGMVPPRASGFIGRAADLGRARAMLRASRLGTVTGPGGVGKTCLALCAADQAASGFRDGAHLIDLSAVRDPKLLAPTLLAGLTAGLLGPPTGTSAGQGAGNGLASGLPASGGPGPGLPGPGLPGSESGLSAPVEQLLGFVRERELLLLIDTCDHLIDACARLVDIMLREAPGLTILATSRQPLDVPGEAVLQLRPLPVPDPRSGTADKADAVTLFARRAEAAVPGFTVTPDKLDDVITVCRRLDGIPLAIDLAAAQLRALPLHQLAGCVDERLRLLIDDLRTGPARHRSLRAAIEWSYSLCSPAERLLWARMSVFAGRFDIAAAEDVCTGGDLDADEILPTLISLVDKNVLSRADALDASQATGPMFLMLDTLREYGAERLRRAAPGSLVRLPGTPPQPPRPASGNATARLAVTACDGTPAGGHLEEAAVPLGEGDPAGTGGHTVPDGGEGVGAAEATVRSRFIAHYLGLAEQFERAPTSDQPGQYQRLLREHVNLRAAFDYALDLPGNDGAAVVLATALRVYWQISGRLHEGEYWLDRAVARCPRRSVVRARVLSARSILRVLIGDFANGRTDAEEAIAMAAAFGDLATAGLGHLTLYTAQALGGDLDAAPEPAAAAADYLTRAGDTFGLAQYDLVDALFQMQAQAPDRALASVAKGLDRLPADEVWCSSYLYLVQSLVLFLQGQTDRAKSTGLLGLAMKHRIRDQLGTAFALGTQAFIAAGQRRHERAAWLIGASGPLWEEVGHRYVGVPIAGTLHEVTERMTREAIGDDRYRELHAAGVAASRDYVIARALADADQLGDPPNAPATSSSGPLTA